MEIFYEGLVTRQYCPWCQQVHDAKIFLSKIRWCCFFHTSCGREKVLGYTMPVEALQKAGIINQPDVSVEPRIQNLVDDFRQEAALQEKWGLDQEASNRTRQKYI
jgi:hypothetical protein